MIDGPLRTFFDKFLSLGSFVAQSSRPYGWVVAAGEVTGSTPLLLNGQNDALGATEEPVWGASAAYVWQTADQQPRLTSTSANDTAGGTGAQSVRVWYLNAAGVEATEDVPTAGGVASVMVAANVRRINRVEVLTVGGGTTGTNIGAITVFATDGATPMAYMGIGQGVADDVIQTVPVGKRDVLLSWGHYSWDDDHAFLVLYTRTGPTAPWIARSAGSNQQSSGVPVPLPVPVILAAGSDYFVAGLQGVGASKAGAFIQGYREAA